jgi:hypothetical protein
MSDRAEICGGQPLMQWSSQYHARIRPMRRFGIVRELQIELIQKLSRIPQRS